MTSERNVTIIIPTLASKARASSLLRAIRSVTTEQEVPALPIVVANGTQFDPDLVEQLKSDRSLRYFYFEEGSIPKALNFARTQVDTEFFGFLDDDDYYYPWAIRERLDTLQADPTADVAVSWGERETPEGRRRSPAAGELDVDDPLRSLMRSNWLASCGGMFRAATISSEYFDPTVPYLEWTYVAFRVALERKIRFVETDRPHFFVADTPGSVSKSLDYILGVGVVLASGQEAAPEEIIAYCKERLASYKAPAYVARVSALPRHWVCRAWFRAPWRRREPPWCASRSPRVPAARRGP